MIGTREISLFFAKNAKNGSERSLRDFSLSDDKTASLEAFREEIFDVPDQLHWQN